MEFQSSPRGKGFWKFDNSLLEDRRFKEEIVKSIQQTEIDNPNTEPTLLWETIKSGIRGQCISFASKRRKEMDTNIKRLENSIQAIDQKIGENNTEEGRERLEQQQRETREELEDHIEKKARWAASKFRNILYEQDEKPTKFFLNQMKERKSNSTLKRLVNDRNEELTTQKDILSEQKNFYKKLYTSTIKDTEEDKIERAKIEEEIFQKPHPKVDTDIWTGITRELTEKELKQIIESCPDNKSPGTDGLNNNFYKAFWPHIKKYLLNSIKATMNNGNLSISQKQGVVSLIPKADKDTSKLKNWRPITLLNQDYKYLAKCLANRCKEVLPSIIDPDQTGFVPNRVIGTNIIKAQCLISQQKEKQSEGLLMSIDFEKAFDTIEWDFITNALTHFNFPPEFISWTKTLYNGINTCIINNGHTSETFQPSRGVRQGCPLSPILFVIAVEYLAEAIRQNDKIQGIRINGKEIKIAQFADDTCLFIENDHNSILEIFNLLDQFAIASGLKINKEKTEILPLGNTTIEDLDQSIRKYVKDSIKLLGVHLTNDRELTLKLNYDPIWEKIENTIKQWQYRGISLQGKIIVLKTFVISKLVYALSVLPSPHKDRLDQLQKTLSSFVWDNKPAKIKKDILIGDYKDGGLRMPEIACQNTGLKTAWIKKLLEYDGNWSNYITEKLPLKDPQYFMGCSIKFADIPNKPERNNIWNEILLKWCMLNKEYNEVKRWTFYEISQEHLWWNSYIKVKNRILEYEHWIKKGITKVCHLLDEDGNWLSLSSFQDKYNIKIPFTELYGIQGAIQKKWGNITQWDLTELDNEHCKLVDRLETKEKTSRTLYGIQIQQKKALPTERREKWGRDLGEEIPEDEWKRHLIHSRKLMVNSKVQTWVYKYVMRAVPYNKKLYEMKLSPDTMCEFCQTETEDIKHLYWECRTVQNLWTYVSSIFKVNINIKLGLLGLQQKCYMKSPGIYLYSHLTRYYIHISRCTTKKPNIHGLTRKTYSSFSK
jgi:hypothetical protein